MKRTYGGFSLSKFDWKGMKVIKILNLTGLIYIYILINQCHPNENVIKREKSRFEIEIICILISWRGNDKEVEILRQGARMKFEAVFTMR